MLRRSGLARAVRDLGVRQRVQETGRRWPPGAWLWSFLYGTLYQGGGFRSFVMDGQSVRCDEVEPWEQVGTDASNWKTTPEGAPFVELDGVSEYLRVADSERNRPGANNLLVVTAYRPDSISGDATIIGKWKEATDDRAWRLRRSGTAVQISTCASGLSGDVVTLESSFVLEAEAWHLIAGYWEAATQLKLWVAKTTDESLTVDLATAAIPATIYAAPGAYVTIGAEDV